jgi:TPR repeat protein
MGVDKNDNEALRWFRLSAKDGNEHAVNRLKDLGLWGLDDDIKNPAANGAKID